MVHLAARPTSNISLTIRVSIWNEWADKNGDLGPVYGAQWRSWPARDGSTIDPIGARVIETIRKKPNSRRLIVTAWNPADVDRWRCRPVIVCSNFMWPTETLLPALSALADMFLGVPFNIASYALLTHMVAHVCGL